MVFQSASMEEDQANNAYGKGPGGRFGNQGFEDFSNSIFIQSQKRRHFLNDEAEKLDRSIRRLIQVYRNLLTHHLAWIPWMWNSLSDVGFVDPLLPACSVLHIARCIVMSFWWVYLLWPPPERLDWNRNDYGLHNDTILDFQ